MKWPWSLPSVQEAGKEIMDDKSRGLYHKYNVTRVDGKPIRQCFVLELHDSLTHNALRRWARDLHEAGYRELSFDIMQAVTEDEQ